MIPLGLFYAHLKSNGELVHFFKHPKLVRMCQEPANIQKVRVTEDPEGPYHAWFSQEKQDFTLIFGHPLQVAVCFPYGPEIEEKSGKGRRCRLKVEVLEDANDVK